MAGKDKVFLGMRVRSGDDVGEGLNTERGAIVERIQFNSPAKIGHK